MSQQLAGAATPPFMVIVIPSMMFFVLALLLFIFSICLLCFELILSRSIEHALDGDEEEVQLPETAKETVKMPVFDHRDFWSSQHTWIQLPVAGPYHGKTVRTKKIIIPNNNP